MDSGEGPSSISVEEFLDRVLLNNTDNLDNVIHEEHLEYKFPEYGKPILLISCINTEVTSDTVKFLLEEGANVRYKDENQWEPLHYAAKRADKSVLKVIIDKLKLEHDLNDVLVKQYNALHILLIYGNQNSKEFVECAKLLIDNGVNSNNDEITLLQCATNTGNVQIVKYLFDKNKDLKTTTNKNTWTPLERAAAFGFHEVFEYLIEKPEITDNIDTNILLILLKNYDNPTIPLSNYKLCCKHFFRKVRTIDVNQEIDGSGNTLLHFAARYSDAEVIVELLKLGSYLGTKNKYGFMPIQCLDPEKLEDLLDYFIQVKDKQGGTNPRFKDEEFSVSLNFRMFVHREKKQVKEQSTSSTSRDSDPNSSQRVSVTELSSTTAVPDTNTSVEQITGESSSIQVQGEQGGTNPRFKHKKFSVLNEKSISITSRDCDQNSTEPLLPAASNSATRKQHSVADFKRNNADSTQDLEEPRAIVDVERGISRFNADPTQTMEELPTTDSPGTNTNVEQTTREPEITTSEKDETSNETHIIDFIQTTPELRHLLKHPLIHIFLFIKWHETKYRFISNIVFYTIFCISLFTYTFFFYGNLEVLPFETFLCYFTWILLLGTSIILTFRELLQGWTLKCKYFLHFENWVEFILLGLVGTICFTDSYSISFRKQLSSVSILLAFFELILMASQLPMFSTNLIMLRTVSFNYLKFILWYSLLIIAFWLSFCIIFTKVPKDSSTNSTMEDNDPFGDSEKSFVKTILMITGDFDDIKFETLASEVIIILFIFLIFITLNNLLNALAVSDIHTIKSDAELVSNIERARYLNRQEIIYLEINKFIPLYLSRRFFLEPKFLDTYEFTLYPNKNYLEHNKKELFLDDGTIRSINNFLRKRYTSRKEK